MIFEIKKYEIFEIIKKYDTINIICKYFNN